ncbi:NYN domain-containing protein [Candidatus Poriferisodalis sp.]|uniref:NYN domain-containing protein n=1 Tax=Candidatus Poriferisodalis sp. TaxID=3101277 RepID=UPI003B027A6A
MSAGPASQHYRVRVFVDFWNYTLAMRDADAGFRTDWSLLGPAVSSAAASSVGSQVRHTYQGMSVHGSYDPSRDRKLLNWATTVLGGFAGVRVDFSPRRKRRGAPSCPRCHASVDRCPQCGSDMRGTEEKGVDVRMAIEMISLAMLGSYDIAVLVSSDRDFIPVAEFLSSRGITVIHAAFGSLGAELSQSCWTRIDLPHLRPSFERS